LSVLTKGQFTDAYKDKPVPPWPAPEVAAAETKAVEAAAPVTVTPAPGKLILTGAATFLQKHLLRNGGHLNFFLNSIDALTLGDELISIRSKQPVDRAITRVSTAAKLTWRLFVTVFVPLLIAAIGFFRVFVRTQSKKNYVKMYAMAE
jgi:hypothetical protein